MDFQTEMRSNPVQIVLFHVMLRITMMGSEVPSSNSNLSPSSADVFKTINHPHYLKNLSVPSNVKIQILIL